MNGRDVAKPHPNLPFIIHRSSFNIFSCYAYRTVTTKNILIFTAVRMETHAIQQAMGGSACRIHAVGIGANHLPSPAGMADISVILMCGVGGGLDPTLKIGDVVLDDPTGLINAQFPHRRGQIHTARKIISSPTEKSELLKQTGALAVDMEQETVRNFAKQLKIPVIGIRAISDTADQMLDPAVVHLVDDLGQPKPASIAIHLLRRPSLIPYLRRLNKNTNIGLVALGNAVRAVVEQLEGNQCRSLSNIRII